MVTMTLKDWLITPVIAALAWSAEIVLIGAMLAVGWSVTDALKGIGWSRNEAVLASIPLMALAGLLAAGLWKYGRVRGRQAMSDVCAEAADRIADWAGWETNPADDAEADR